MNEIQQVGRRRPESLNAEAAESSDRVEDFAFGVAAVKRMEQSGKGTLILGMLIDVGNGQFWLPQEGVIRAFENLPLFSDQGHHGLER